MYQLKMSSSLKPQDKLTPPVIINIKAQTGFTQVQGITWNSDNSFTVNIDPVNLPTKDGQQYIVECLEFDYINNATFPPIASAVLLCDISKPIRDNNTTASILIKSSEPSGAAGLIRTNGSNSSILPIELERTQFRSITFSLQRTDNGEPYPSAYVDILLKISQLE